MQGDSRHAHTFALQCGKQLITEMQSCCRCRDSTGPIGIAGLISLSIIRIMPIDVRRQWNLPALIEQILNRFSVGTIRGELDQSPSTGRILGQNRQTNGCAINREDITWPHSFCRTRQTQPLPLTPRLENQQLRQATTSTTNLQPRLEHSGVVDHQQITGLEFRQEIPDLAMTDCIVRHPPRGHQHQPRTVTRLNRCLGDPFLRQVVVVTAELVVPVLRHPIKAPGFPGGSRSVPPDP